jgi:acyl-CoA thioesterase
VSAPGPDFLVATTAGAPDARGRRPLVVHDTWLQGKGVFGGIALGALARAMIEHTADERRALRTLHVHYAAPLVPGDAELAVSTERKGATVSHVSGRIFQADRTVALASASFAFARETIVPPSLELAPPTDVRAFADTEPTAPPPVFCQHFEYRFALGALPWTGAAEARLGGWIRPRVPTALDAPLAGALIDAFPPPSNTRSPERIHSASVDLTLHLARALPTDLKGDAPFLVESRSTVAYEGYADQQSRLWTQDGRYLGAVRQLVALLG